MGKRSQERMTNQTHEQRVNIMEKVSGKHGRPRCWRDLRRVCPHTGIFFNRDAALKCMRKTGICKEMREEKKKEEN